MISATVVTCAIASIPSRARATISAQFLPVPITATTDAATPSPGIQGYQCYDLVVTGTAGDPTREAPIFLNPPPSGSFFQQVFDNGSPNYGPPNPSLIPPFPVMQFDSFLDSPLPGAAPIARPRVGSPASRSFARWNSTRSSMARRVGRWS
jgi:hypothetical protein